MKSELISDNVVALRELNLSDFFAKCKHLSSWNASASFSLNPSKQVVTCFLVRDQKVLVLQRGRKDLQYKLWGIPGGKLMVSEQPVQGLQREIFEETGAWVEESSFTFLDSAISKTADDGKYGLYLYCAEFPCNLEPMINLDEHLGYQWVTLEQFQSLELLHAQKEAFLLVKSRLQNQINNMDGNYATR